MQSNGVVLYNSSFVGSSASQSIFWDGGRSVLAVTALVYAPNALQLQLQGPTGRWLNVGSSIVTNQLFPFDAPAGQYRMACQGSSVIGVSAKILTVNYN